MSWKSDQQSDIIGEIILSSQPSSVTEIPDTANWLLDPIDTAGCNHKGYQNDRTTRPHDTTDRRTKERTPDRQTDCPTDDRSNERKSERMTRDPYYAFSTFNRQKFPLCHEKHRCIFREQSKQTKKLTLRCITHFSENGKTLVYWSGETSDRIRITARQKKGRNGCARPREHEKTTCWGSHLFDLYIMIILF